MHDAAVERAAGGDEARPVLSAHHLLDQRINGRAAHAGHVARVFGRCGLAAKKVGVFGPGGVGAAVGQRNDVEVETAQALLIQSKVHWPKTQRHAQLLQVAHPGRDDPGARLGAVQVLQLQGLASGIAQGTIAERPARFAQQIAGAPQVLPQITVAVGARGLVGRAEHGCRQQTTPGRQQLQLLRCWQAAGCAIGVAKQALHPQVGVVEHLPVHPLVVHRQRQRLSHPHIVQGRAPGVEHITLKPGRQPVVELGLDQLAAVKALSRDTPGPVAGRKKAHQIELARLQRFQPRGVVAVDLDRDAVEIGRSLAHRQVARPVVGVAHIGDVAAEAHGADAIRPAADRDVHHDLVKGLALPGLGVRLVAPGAAEHRQTANRQGQFAAGLVKPVAQDSIAQHVEPSHILQDGLVGRRRMGTHQGVEAVLDIGRQHRIAIVEACLWSQAKRGRQPIGRQLHALGQQAVSGPGFIQRAGQQGIEHQGRQIGRGAATQGKRVVFVEGAGAKRTGQPQFAAFGRLRVDVGKVRKVGRVLQLAPDGIAVRGPGGGRQQAAGSPDQYLAGTLKTARDTQRHATILREISQGIETWVFLTAKSG